MNKRDEQEDNGIKKLIKIMENILFAMFMIVMVGLIFITAQSRLTGQEPALLSHRIYIVDSGSMSPTIKVGSMIIVKEMEPQEIKEGDIITYYGSTNSVKVTHRVVEVQQQGQSFITRGDANETNDPMPLEAQKVIGKVVFTIPFIGVMFSFISTGQGIATLLILGAAWILVPKLLHRQRKGLETTQQGSE